MLSSFNMLATVPTWIRTVSYSHTHSNAPWIIAHIAKTPTNPGRSEHECGQASCHSTGQYAHVAYGKPCQGAGHWCRVDMHSILPSHSPPRSMHIARTQPKIHLSAGCLGMCMPKRAGTAQASACPLPPVSSVMEPDAGVARMCTPYLPAHAPSCTKRTTRKLKNPSDHGWFEHMAAQQAAVAFTKL